MSACDELRPKAAWAASLPEGDPERAEYLEHARDCPGCMQAFRQGEQLMRLIAASPPARPSEAALQRASAPILAELRAAARPKPRIAGLPARLVFAAAVIPGFLIPLWIGRHLDPGGWPVALLVLGAALLLAATAGAVRGGALIVLAAAAAFAFAAGGVPGVPQVAAPLNLGDAACPILELIAAALPLAAAAVVYRSNPAPGALAQAAAAGALAGQAALHIACPDRHQVVHLWAAHVAGVFAAAILGYLLEGPLRRAELS